MEGKKHPNKPYHLGLKLHKQEILSICFACLPALDACDCREINPFNNLWLKFEDFQFFFFFTNINKFQLKRGFFCNSGMCRR